MDEHEYRSQLEYMKKRLESQCKVDIRGSGKSQFIFAKNNTGAVEISGNEDGIWVKFWKGDSEIPIKDETFKDFASAINASMVWLVF